MRAFFAFVLSVVLSGHVCADTENGLRALLSADDLRGLEGVGRLDIRSGGFCTGIVVSSTLVLTAAHCLFDRDSNTPHPAEDLIFRAALRNGHANATRMVRRMVVHPGYRQQPTSSVTDSISDLALLELDRALDQNGLRPFPASERLHPGDSVQVVSYARTRTEAPSLEEDCHILDRDTRLMVLTCDVDFGASGSPVLVQNGPDRQVVGLISAMTDDLKGDRVAIAVPIEAGLHDLVKEFARTPTLPPVRKTVRTNGGETGTIRFLRPGN